MIRVMHILGELDGVGGTARLLLYLLKHSNPDEVQHSFVCMQRGALQSEFEALGATVEVIGSASPLGIIKGALQLARKVRPDIISTHFTRALVCGSVVAALRDIPLIHNEHGPANRAEGSRLARMLRPILLRRSALVICNSKFTASTIAETYRVPRTSLSVIHLPVERRVNPRRRNSPQHKTNCDELCIGHVGGMIATRFQDTLLRALSCLLNNRRRVKLLLVGDGPRRAELEQLARDLNLGASIEFTGYQEDLEVFFDRIDIYVNPAAAEGFGIAVVEAMLEAKPVVLANSGSHPELIEPGVSGLLYKARDAQHLAENIGLLIDHPELRARLGKAGREHAAKLFTGPRYARVYLEQIRAVLARADSYAAVAPHGR